MHWREMMAIAVLAVATAWGRNPPASSLPDGKGPPWRELTRDINQAVVFSINNRTTSDHDIDLARQAGTEVLIRGWFKWRDAPQFVGDRQGMPGKVHAFGALFGGGVTCSALYDHENGITAEQLLEMATRGRDGHLVDAWGRPGVRHGSLSSPMYLDYLFRWSREQIDAGVDYLFMDENNAALGPNEGYDEPSLADFRAYLLGHCPQTRGWMPADARWRRAYRIDLANTAICPDGTVCSFDYRAYLRTQQSAEPQERAANPMAPLWRQFRVWRDDRAWKALTDRIRAYARKHDRSVLISANGLARYVDLQVLGVWKKWTTKAGHIEESENLLPYWHSLVERGRALAGRRVPVVLFHDWGMGHPPFPWLSVPVADRVVWMRTRGAEIYAAGAFFAFPVLGPYGCDAGKDGTLPAIVGQTAFYRIHRDFYLNAEYLGAGSPWSSTPNLSFAVWSGPGDRTILLHVINRNVVAGALRSQKSVGVMLPVGCIPVRVTEVSPDFEGERPASCHTAGDHLEVDFGNLQAYSVAVLRYASPVDVGRLRDPAALGPADSPN